MNIRRFAFVRKLQGALRFITRDYRRVLNEITHLRKRVEVLTERYWATRFELRETAEERDAWRERAAMLERLHDENREKAEGRRRPSKALPNFQLRQVLSGPVTAIIENRVYVRFGDVDWLVAIPEFSWGDIDSPSMLVSIGEMARVKVLSTPADSEHPFLVLV